MSRTDALTSSGTAAWELVALVRRARDHDAAYADAPVLDAYARISRNPLTGDLEKTDRQLADVLASIRGRRARLGEVLRDDNKSAWSRKARRDGWDALVARLT
ncbi:MAG: recombinase family protein, partial [Actinomycetia bacterium]|nr:recombinase family protein [Actinomycetes bacterium]